MSARRGAKAPRGSGCYDSVSQPSLGALRQMGGTEPPRIPLGDVHGELVGLQRKSQKDAASTVPVPEYSSHTCAHVYMETPAGLHVVVRATLLETRVILCCVACFAKLSYSAVPYVSMMSMCMCSYLSTFE